MADEQKKRSYPLSDMEKEGTFLDTLFHLKQVRREFCIQAIVTKYDGRTNIATVRPLIDYKTDGKRPLIDVPVMNFCHGGFLIHFPVFVGDTGWVIAGDRNGAEAMKKNAAILKTAMSAGEFGNETAGKNFGNTNANDDGICSFSYGFFVPNNWSERDDELVKDPNTLTIASVDKNIHIQIGGEDTININGMIPQRMTLLTDVIFNQASHELKKEFTEIDGIVKVGNVSQKNVFTATPLSAELEDDPGES